MLLASVELLLIINKKSFRWGQNGECGCNRKSEVIFVCDVGIVGGGG